MVTVYGLFIVNVQNLFEVVTYNLYRIQALWRGYRVRKWYASHQQKNPPKHPLLRRRHYQDKLSRLTAHMIQSCDQTGMGAESVMAEADLAIAEARHAMRCVLHLNQEEL